MSFTHYCHFHPEQKISHFCPNSQCTLPLCSECRPIHMQNHAQQHLDNQMITFSQAYEQAIDGVEEYLVEQRKAIKNQHKELDQDREKVMKAIDAYYFKTSKAIEEHKQKVHQVEQQLTKLKRGSIKTLIFYYTGDIKLEHLNVCFQPLLQKVENWFTKPATPKKSVAQEKQIKVAPIQRQPSPVITRPSSLVKIHTAAHEHHNIFNSIDQTKLGDKNKQKTRKSIFQMPKKANDHQSTKYHYNVNVNGRQSTQTERIVMEKAEPVYQHRKLASEDIPAEVKERTQQKEPQTPISFEHRYTNKFTGAEQYQAYKREKDEKMTRLHQRSYQDKQNHHQQKVLRTTDLDLQYKLTEHKPLSIYNNNKTNQTNQTNLSNQKRSVSHTQLARHETKVQQDHGYDLKKQVLAPEQIRKMLEKRMEQRNRILTMKKSQDYTAPPTDGRKLFQTRDSIINQIYKDQN